MFANCLVPLSFHLSLHSRVCLGLSALTQPWASLGLRMRILRMIWVMWVNKKKKWQLNVMSSSPLSFFFVLICRSLVSELYLCSFWLLGSGWPVRTLQQYRPFEGEADPPAGLHAACHSSVWPCSPGENYNSYTATLLLQSVLMWECVCVYFCATAETTPNLNVGEVFFN